VREPARGSIRLPSALTSPARLVALAVALASMAAAPAARAQRLVWVDTYYHAPALREQNLDGSGFASFSLPAGTLPEALARDPQTDQFYFADAAWLGAAIHRASGTLGVISTPVTGQHSILGLAVHPTNGRMYWTVTAGTTGPAIVSSNLDGSGFVTLATLPAGSTPRGIAVDGVHGKLYVADFARRLILACNLDGSGLATLLGFSAPARPWGIAVDPASSLLYWCDYAGGLLQRSSTSGGGVTTLEAGLGNPTDVALDPAGGNVYWVEAALHAQRIRRAALAGGAITLVSSMVSAHGGLVVDRSRNTAVESGEAPVTRVEFGPARPSPATGPVSFTLALPEPARVSLVVVDVQGRAVATLRDGMQSAGRTVVAWDARASGRPAAPGVYFARMRTGNGEWVRRIVIER
jgi:hypothetical protein